MRRLKIATHRHLNLQTRNAQPVEVDTPRAQVKLWNEMLSSIGLVAAHGINL
jgi:hypothetical protein